MANENNRLVALVEGVIVNVGSEATPGKAERVITELGREFDGLVSDGNHVCDASGARVWRSEDYVQAVVNAQGKSYVFNEQNYAGATRYGQTPNKVDCLEESDSGAFWKHL